MSKTILVCPDSHAHPDYNNNRANWLGELLHDLKPDIFLHLGDGADLASLSSYDKGKRAFQGRSYAKDIEAHLDFQERLWDRVVKSKKKRPDSIYLIGNHEERINKALDLSPELEGTIGFKDLQLERYYDVTVPYDGGTPGVVEVEGILAAHFFLTGISGRPIGGEHAAYSHSIKVGQSTISGHSHLLDYNTRTNISGRTLNNLVAGCYQDYINPWAGLIGKLWRPGVSVLRNVEDGRFDLQFISLESLKKEYSSV